MVLFECDAKDATKLIRYFKYIFPSSLNDKKKIGTSLSLGYSFNFVPLFSNGKAIKSTPEVLQHLINLQKHIFEDFVEEEQCDDIKTSNMDSPLLQDETGDILTLREYLMSLRQKTCIHKGSKLFMAISRGNIENMVIFQYFKVQKDKVLNVLCGLPKMMEVELKSNVTTLFLYEATERASEEHGILSQEYIRMRMQFMQKL